MAVFSDIDPAAVAARWADAAPPTPDLAFCPPHELTRTPAAARIGAMAAASGLFCFHFEHRVHLDLPEHHVPSGFSEDLAEAPTWSAGVLPERKYQSFRHDLPLGSFHPRHRGKWTVHELCHGLIGTAWSPRATPFVHATASRLAELLPVALWYWFDEAFLVRCPLHAGGGALFRTFCAECEAVQGRGPDAGAAARIADGIAYLEAELAAVDASRRSGSIVPHRFATLDLSSDGVAYARAHGARLTSSEFHAFVERFGGDGIWPSLDVLVARVVEVTRGLLLDAPVAPLANTPEQGRWRWILQDLAWRLLCIQGQTGGAAAEGLGSLVDHLADGLTGGAEQAVGAAWEGYRALFEDWELPDPGAVFALGYPIPGLEDLPDAGAASQLTTGLGTVSPRSLELAPDAVPALVRADRETPTRRPIQDRWADALQDPAARAVARFEAAVANASTVPGSLGGPSAGTWRLAPRVRIERFATDVIALVEGRPPTEAALVLGFAPGPTGEPTIVGLEPHAADALDALPGPLALAPDEIAGLEQLGLIEPASYAELA